MKRAQMDTILNWIIFRMGIIITVTVAFVLILTAHYSSGLIKRLLYSPELLAYEDGATDRVYPGIVDYEKFDTTRLEDALLSPNNNVAVNLELINLASGESRRAYVNEERARVWDDWSRVGGFDANTLQRYVQIYENGTLYPGVLRMNVLVRT